VLTPARGMMVELGGDCGGLLESIELLSKQAQTK
jgi:hypothetical protein